MRTILSGPEAVATQLSGLRGWCRENQARCLLAAAVLVAMSGGMLLVATQQRNLWFSLIAAIVGAALGSLGLLLVNEPIRVWLNPDPDTPPDRRRLRMGALLGFGVTIGGVGLTWIGLVIETRGLTALGMIAVILGQLVINAWLMHILVKPQLVTLGGLAAFILALLLLSVTGDIDWRSLLGGVAWIGGLIAFKLGLGPWIREAPTRPMFVFWVAVAATVLGALLLIYTAANISRPALVLGMGLITIGLSAIGIATLRLAISISASFVIIGAGILAVGAGFLLTFNLVNVGVITLVAALVLGAIGAWFVFRGEGIVAAVLIGFVLVWIVVDRTTDVAADPNPDAPARILALGDSYISGEGAPKFFEGTNIVGQESNQCRRAPTAYPFLVAEELDMGLDFFACSGARTSDMDGVARDTDPDPGEVPGHEDQMLTVRARGAQVAAATDLVLVGIGGNDVNFGTIIQACLLPASCADLASTWLAQVDGLRSTLEDTYRLILAEVPNTPVIVVPYPLITDRDGCGLAIDDSEHSFVVDFTNALNDEIVAAAAAAGVHVYLDAAEAFAGARLCDDDPATNFFHLSPTEGEVIRRILPSNWVHGSMHPRAEGHARIAFGSDEGADDGLVIFVDDLLASVAAGGEPNPQPIPATNVVQETDRPPIDGDAWITEQLYAAARSLLAPVMLLIVGGLLLALGTAKQRWRLSVFLAPDSERVGGPPDDR